MADSPRPMLHAFIDESGQRGHSPKASRHFVMSAVVMWHDEQPVVSTWLAGLREELGRSPGETLHFQNLKSHADRLHACMSVGSQETLAIISVVVCKDHLVGTMRLNDDQAYLYTFRFLLERLSWLARDKKADIRYTLAHIHRFKIAKLREYESILRATGKPECSIEWAHIHPAGGTVDQPNRVEMLQVADIAVSGIAQAFEPDRFGNTERRYLTELLPRIWARGSGGNRYTTYGLKMHPWSTTTKAAYPWVATL